MLSCSLWFHYNSSRLNGSWDFFNLLLRLNLLYRLSDSFDGRLCFLILDGGDLTSEFL